MKTFAFHTISISWILTSILFYHPINSAFCVVYGLWYLITYIVYPIKNQNQEHGK